MYIIDLSSVGGGVWWRNGWKCGPYKAEFHQLVIPRRLCAVHCSFHATAPLVSMAAAVVCGLISGNECCVTG